MAKPERMAGVRMWFTVSVQAGVSSNAVTLGTACTFPGLWRGRSQPRRFPSTTSINPRSPSRAPMLAHLALLLALACLVGYTDAAASVNAWGWA